MRNAEGDEVQLTINYIELSCFLPTGTVIEREVNCNSAFMLQVLPEIAAEMHQQLHWVPHDGPIFLVIDNAGGHGMQEARDEYTRRLRDNFNIVIMQQ